MIKVQDFVFDVENVITFRVSDSAQLDAVKAIADLPGVMIADIDQNEPNKGEKAAILIAGIANGEIEFATREEIADATNSTLANVSTILGQSPYGDRYRDLDKAHKALIKARKVAQETLAANPALAALVAQGVLMVDVTGQIVPAPVATTNENDSQEDAA